MDCAPLIRLKILIWVHSAIGALLLVGLPAVAIGTDRIEPAAALLPGLIVWSFGYRSLQKKAEELAPEARVPATGLPFWIVPMVFVGGFLSPPWLMLPYGGWVAATWLLLGATIAIRWVISKSLAIPVHRQSWAGLLLALFSPFVVYVLLISLIYLFVGCE